MTTANLTRSQLRRLCEDTSASAQSQLQAANLLIDTFGLSDRNRRLAKRTAKRFAKYICQSPRTQIQVRYQAERLLARIERALEAEDTKISDHNEPEAEMGAPVAEEHISRSSPLIGTLQLIPPDGDDPSFWDQPISGTIRRRLFFRSWGLDESLTRSEAVATITGDTARMEAHTLRVQLWAMTRDQADAKFATDSALVHAALAQRGLPASAEGREKLTQQILASGEPLFQFQPPTPANDADATGLPTLRRSKAGLLIDAINFIESWPLVRPKHQPL